MRNEKRDSRPMVARPRIDPITVGLIALCIPMGWIGYQKHLRAIQPLLVNEDLSRVMMVDAEGNTSSLATGAPTVLLVFDSKCAPCRRAAPRWRQWLQSRPQVNVFAVSREPPEVAQSFGRDFDLDVPVRHIPWRRANRSAALYSQGVPSVVLLTPDGEVSAQAWGGSDGSILESAHLSSQSQRPFSRRQ